MFGKAACICLLTAATALSLDAQEAPKRAKLDDGTTVLLFADGTWRVEPTTAQSASSGGQYTKPSNATQSVAILKVATVSYDPDKWKPTTSREPGPGRYKFTHVTGDGSALVIFERIQMTQEGLIRGVLRNAREAVPDARTTLEEPRTVNGVKVTCLQFEGTIQDIPTRYLGYYYAGKAGSI